MSMATRRSAAHLETGTWSQRNHLLVATATTFSHGGVRGEAAATSTVQGCDACHDVLASRTSLHTRCVFKLELQTVQQNCFRVVFFIPRVIPVPSTNKTPFPCPSR